MAVPAFGEPYTAPASESSSGVQYNGLFDAYYLFQFNNPKYNSSLDDPSYIRYYDFRQNTPTLQLGEINVFKTPKPGGTGFYTSIGTGDVAVSSVATSTPEGEFQALRQIYGSYEFKNGAGFDIGKFYTPFGYEWDDSNLNFNETHSVPFSIIPYYHAGIRAYTQSYKGFVLTGDVVQAIYNTNDAGLESDTRKASYIGNIVWTDPRGKWSVWQSVGSGINKYNLLFGEDVTQNKVTISDTNATYNLGPKDVVAADYCYVTTDPQNTSDSTNAKDNTWALYYKRTLSSKTDAAFRFSSGDFEIAGSPSYRLWEATATYEVRPMKNFITRFEYQHSGANSPTFLNSNSMVTKTGQDIIEIAALLTFAG